jgi:hypothetical protein
MATFRFRIPTQPPSVNHMYVSAPGYTKEGKRYSRRVKDPDVLQYQIVASSIAKHAAPTGWRAPKWVRIRYWFHLKDDADCDNLLKALNDSFATAWKINDRWFLPCVQEKTTGNKDPYVEVEVDDEQG